MYDIVTRCHTSMNVLVLRQPSDFAIGVVEQWLTPNRRRLVTR